MKVVILAGGLGTRLSEETLLIPKPMIEIGGHPILWHIMKTYSYYGFNDFVILTGYKSHVIKDFFVNYYTRYSDITVDMDKNSVEIHKTRHEPWSVTMLYTGQDTMTAGRIHQAQKYVGDERFMLTYGDGVADIDILKLVESHEKSGKIGTLTTTQPQGRFGLLEISEGNEVKSFVEKPINNTNCINSGYFVFEPKIFEYIESGDPTVAFEQQPMRNITRDKQLNAYKHEGFWKPMDTLRDKIELTDMWSSGCAPWAVWL